MATHHQADQRPGYPAITKSRKRTRDEIKEELTSDLIVDQIEAIFNNHSQTTRIAVDQAKALISRLNVAHEKALTSQRHLESVNAARINELERQVTKLKTDNASMRLAVDAESANAAAWKRKNESLASANETLQMAAADALAKQRFAESRLEPVSMRLASLQEIGRRVHGVIIRRVMRLDDLEKRAGRGGEDHAELLREMHDNTFVLVHGWRRLEAEYVLQTHSGEFTEWTTSEDRTSFENTIGGSDASRDAMGTAGRSIGNTGENPGTA